MKKHFMILFTLLLLISCSGDDDGCGCKTFETLQDESITLFTCENSLEFATNPNEDVQELIDMCN